MNTSTMTVRTGTAVFQITAILFDSASHLTPATLSSVNTSMRTTA